MRKAEIFYKADKDYGSRVAKGFSPHVKKIIKLAEMSQDDRAKTKQ